MNYTKFRKTIFKNLMLEFIKGKDYEYFSNDFINASLFEDGISIEDINETLFEHGLILCRDIKDTNSYILWNKEIYESMKEK